MFEWEQLWVKIQSSLNWGGGGEMLRDQYRKNSSILSQLVESLKLNDIPKNQPSGSIRWEDMRVFSRFDLETTGSVSSLAPIEIELGS